MWAQVSTPGGTLPAQSLGPLHKSRDHEIVRAQKKGSNGRPKAPLEIMYVVTVPQV